MHRQLVGMAIEIARRPGDLDKSPRNATLMARIWKPSMYRSHDAQTPPPNVGQTDHLARAVGGI
jgi:hypothetical protein